jgi:hypothetical protein
MEQALALFIQFMIYSVGAGIGLSIVCLVWMVPFLVIRSFIRKVFKEDRRCYCDKE